MEDEMLMADPAVDDMGVEQDFAAAAIERNRRMMRGRDGNNPMGPAFSFQERRNEQLAVQRYSIICFAVVGLILLLLVVLICELFKKDGVSCGIPVITWVEIFFVIIFGAWVLGLFMLFVLYNCYNDYMKWQIAWSITILTLLFAWVIYGYVIYFSEDNDCQEKPGTSGWLIFMVIILVIMILIYSCLLCCVLPLVLYIMHVQEQQMRGPDGLEDSEIPQVIEKLNRTPFDPAKFKFENECKICLMEYEENDELTQLKCDERHYFHTDCIIRWISEGKNNCPLCRKPIENVEELRAMMEGGEISVSSNSRRNRRQNAPQQENQN